jgi:hypothetical protein
MGNNGTRTDLFDQTLAVAGRAVDWVADLFGDGAAEGNAEEVEDQAPRAGQVLALRRRPDAVAQSKQRVQGWREVREMVQALTVAVRQGDPEARAAAGSALVRIGQIEASIRQSRRGGLPER